MSGMGPSEMTCSMSRLSSNLTFGFAARFAGGACDGRAHSRSPAAIGWVFPDQDGNGTHVNISGAGVTKYAPNRKNAVKFLEYLTSESAQNYFAAGNDEYPVLEGVALSASVVQLGTFKADDLNLDELGKNQARAQEIYNEIGYK